MNNKIQELTDIIYNEGVIKGREEADKILTDANTKAEQILSAAKKESERILVAAKKKAAELSENTKNELKLYASHSLSALKSEIASAITDTIVKEEIDNFSKSSDYLNQFILSLATQWAEKENVVISTPDAEGLKKYFLSKAKHILNKGITINQVNGMKSFFSIAPADGSYKIIFGEEEFENYFKSFLRPLIIDTLF